MISSTVLFSQTNQENCDSLGTSLVATNGMEIRLQFVNSNISGFSFCWKSNSLKKNEVIELLGTPKFSTISKRKEIFYYRISSDPHVTLLIEFKKHKVISISQNIE
jgi:hypothetical protein